MAWDATALFEAMDDVVGVIDRDLRWIYTNAAGERMAGRTRDQLIGTSILEVFPDGERTAFFAALQRAIATGQPQSADSYYPPFDRWFCSQIYVIGDHIHIVTRDITMQKQAEARLLVLSRAAHASARAVDLEQLCEAIASSLAELVGDACIIRLVEKGCLRPVSVQHPDPGRREALRSFFALNLAVQEGLSARVLETGEPLLIERVDNGELRSSFIGEEPRARVERGPAHSVAAVVLTNGTERIGVLTLLRDRTPRPYTRADLSLLEDLADRASMAFTRARLYEHSQQQARRAQALADVSRAFSAAERDTRTIMDLLARAAVAELGDVVVVSLVSADGTLLQPVGFDAEPPLPAEIHRMLDVETPVAGSVSERVIASGASMRLTEVDIDAFSRSVGPRYEAMVRELQPRSFMIAPIKLGNLVLGVISATRRKAAKPYDELDQRMLEELADRAALAIENARVLEAERLARQAAERIAEQTRSLQAIGSHFSHRRSPSDVAATILRESSAVLGGANGAIWLLDDSGRQLQMLASIAYPDTKQYTTFSLDADLPLSTAVRTGQPLFLANSAEYAAQFPASAERLGDARLPEFSTACLPLINEGRAIGGLALSFRHARAFVADERTFMGVLASVCAQAIDRSRLLEQERVASAALAESNRTLNAVIHASPAAIIITDPQGVIQLWNPAAEHIFGWTAGDVLGKCWPAIDDAMRPEFVANLGEIARGKHVSGYETRRMRRDGTAIDVALWGAPVQRPDGEMQALAVFIDVTDRKHAEEAARAADRRKDEFLAMLGHELRNPLAPILTALELMRFRQQTGGERERETIERQTRHLVRLVDDLLDISRITRGKLTLRKQRVDLGAAIAHAVEMASPLLEQRNHHVSIAAPRGLVFVDGDEFRLAQIFQNLLTNAAKYTPSGGSITVRLRLQDDRAIADVEDNGVGIATEVLPTIFEPFVQGAQKLDRSQGGLGIGLTLVRSLSELHGGHVHASSPGPGQGSSFSVNMPLSPAVADGQHTAEVPALRGGSRRVLLVDDNRDAAEMLAELLRAAGHEVVVAFDGPSALGSLAGFRPDIALLDIGLPVMDGYDLARKLKAALPAAPRMIAISGYGQEHDHRRSQEAGFHAHLVKPVQAAQVLAVVDAAS